MSDELLDALAQTYSSIRAEHTRKEIIEGVHEHTFTPSYEPTDAAGTLTYDALSRAWDDIYANARLNSHMLLVSVEDARRVRHFYRLGRMYRAHPIPRRKIRKCHMRKLHAAWCKGGVHIRRVEQAERAREEAAMHRMREDNGSEPILH